MTFAFYRDVRRKELETKVVSVRRAKWKPAGAAKKAPAVDGFEVTLEDTVLFPEGGGQGRNGIDWHVHDYVLHTAPKK